LVDEQNYGFARGQPEPGSAEWWAQREPKPKREGPKVGQIVFAAFVIGAFASGGLFFYDSFAAQTVASTEIPPIGGADTLNVTLSASTTYSVALDTLTRSCFNCSMQVDVTISRATDGEVVWSETQRLDPEDDIGVPTSYILGAFTPSTNGAYNVSYATSEGRGAADWTLTLALRSVLVAPEVLFAVMFASIFGAIGTRVAMWVGRKHGG
jgi:hypothetical protein